MTNITEILRNTISNGDCLQLMPELPTRSVDFILTDPPYIVNYKSRDGRKIANDDNDEWLHPHLLKCTAYLQIIALQLGSVEKFI